MSSCFFWINEDYDDVVSGDNLPSLSHRLTIGYIMKGQNAVLVAWHIIMALCTSSRVYCLDDEEFYELQELCWMTITAVRKLRQLSCTKFPVRTRNIRTSKWKARTPSYSPWRIISSSSKKVSDTTFRNVDEVLRDFSRHTERYVIRGNCLC